MHWGYAMPTSRSTKQCTSCETDDETFEYHGDDLRRMVLCKVCYDDYMAKEMTQYWKDHIQEEKRRTGMN